MLLVCFLLATVLNATEPANETVHFEADINVALQKAQKSAKSQIIIFSAKWCLPCATMKENTFSDQDLINFMNENTINSLVDIDTESGFLLKLQYNITMLPTIIITDDQGNEIARKSEAMNAPNFIKYISKYVKPNSSKIKAETETTKKQETTATKNDDISANKPTKEVQNLDFNKVKIASVTRKGFGVQVGLYSSYEAVFTEIDRLQKMFPNQTILLLRPSDSSTGSVKLIMGEFDEKPDAVLLKNKLKSQNIDGFLKDLSSY